MKRMTLAVSWGFWVFAGLLGYFSTESILGTLLWIAVIFVSVLVHEFGHALTACCFGKTARIELIAFGGLTYYEGNTLSFPKQILITFNGPLFGFFLFLLAYGLLHVPSIASGPFAGFLTLLKIANLFWTLLNLFPVLPLDGGQLVRMVLEGVMGVRGVRVSLMVSLCIAAGISLLFFLYQNFLIGALFFLFAFQSYEQYRKMRHLRDPDRLAQVKILMLAAEAKLKGQDIVGAEELLKKIRALSKTGLSYTLATQWLSFLEEEKGNSRSAYELLLPIRVDLDPEGLCLLHKTAFEQKNYPLVVDLGSVSFQHWPLPEVALRNSYAHAQLLQVAASLGWLETALEEAPDQLDYILGNSLFDPIRQDPMFQSWLKT